MPRPILLSLPMILLAGCSEPGAAPPVEAEAQAVSDEVVAPEVAAGDSIDDDKVAALLYAELEEDLGAPDELQLHVGESDLDGDGTAEVLAYAISPMICGTGGCGLYVLGVEGDGYRILDRIGPARLPVYKLAAGADGWTGLGVSVSGGGMAGAVMAVPHGADGYADNPTVAPATPVEPGDAEVIIAGLPPVRTQPGE